MCFIYFLNLTDVGAEVRSNMQRDQDGNWQCLICGYASKYTTRVLEHIEAKHLMPSAGYQCDQCPKLCSTKNALKCHVYRYHSKGALAH